MDWHVCACDSGERSCWLVRYSPIQPPCLVLSVLLLNICRIITFLHLISFDRFSTCQEFNNRFSTISINIEHHWLIKWLIFIPSSIWNKYCNTITSLYRMWGESSLRTGTRECARAAHHDKRSTNDTTRTNANANADARLRADLSYIYGVNLTKLPLTELGERDKHLADMSMELFFVQFWTYLKWFNDLTIYFKTKTKQNDALATWMTISSTVHATTRTLHQRLRSPN